MFGLLVWLIFLGFFDEVKYCFMLVGHTHDDNDQFFSHLSTFLHVKGVRTLEELLQRIVQSHPGLHVFAEVLQEHVNMRDFVDQFLLPLHNISKPLNFHFKNIDNNCIMFRYRLFQDCEYSVWMPIMKQTPSPVCSLKAATDIKVTTSAFGHVLCLM